MNHARPTIYYNVGFQLASHAGVLLTQLAYVVMVTRALDLDSFGRFSLAAGAVQMVLMVSDLGLNVLIVRQVASSPTSQTAFGQLLFLKTVLAVMFSTLLAVAGKLWADVETSRVLAIFAAGMAVHSIVLAFGMAFQGSGQLYISSLTSFVLAVLQLVFAAVFLWTGGRVISLGVAYLLAALITLLVNYFLFTAKIHHVNFYCGSTSTLRYMKQALPLGLGTALNSIANRIDVALLFYLGGAADVGLYAGAYRITGTLYNVPVGIFAAILPFFSRLSWKTPEMDEILERTLLVAVVSASVLFLFFVIAGPEVVVWLFGTTYLPAGHLLQILSWALIPAFINVGLMHASASQKSTAGNYSAAAAMGATTNIVLNLWWIPTSKSRGASYATVATELVVLGAYLYLLRREIRAKALRRPAKALGLALCAYFISWPISLEGILSALPIVGMYLLLLFWLGEFSHEDWQFWTRQLAPVTDS